MLNDDVMQYMDDNTPIENIASVEDPAAVEETASVEDPAAVEDTASVEDPAPMDDIMEVAPVTVQMGDMPTTAAQKVLNMLFLVDTSGSMRFHGKIQALNEAFRQMIPALRQIQTDVNTEFELRIAIMTFNRTAEWIVPPTPIFEYHHSDIIPTGKLTYYSEAFKALGEKLSKDGYMAHTGKIAAPYIMFLTDGAPTPDDTYQAELETLNQNEWYQNSQRFAVLIGANTVNNQEARDAVKLFVNNGDEKEGIVDAEDAISIIRDVQAKTLRIVGAMTKKDISTQFTNIDDSGSVFTDFDNFDDTSFI